MRLYWKFIVFLILVIVTVSDSEGIEFWEIIKSSWSNFFSQFRNIDDFINNQTITTWNALKVEDYMQLGSEKIRELLSKGRNQIPQRALDIIQLALVNNMTMEEIVRKIKNPPDGTTRYEIARLFKELSRPQMWTRENVTLLQDAIFRLPNSFILECQNTSTLQLIKDMVDNMLRSVSGEERQRYLLLQKQLLLKIKGPPEEWTNDTFRSIPLDEISPDMFGQIQLSAIKSRKAEILNKASTKVDEFSKRIYLTRILEAERLAEEEDPIRALDIANGVSPLKSSLVPEDFNSYVLTSIEIKKILKENTARLMKTFELSPKSVLMVMDQMAAYGNITYEIAKTEGMNMIGLALPSHFKTAADNEAITLTDFNDLVEGMKNAKSLGMDAKIGILVSVLEDELHDSNGDIAWSELPPEIIERLSLNMMRKVNANDAKILLTGNANGDDNLNLNDQQIAILLEKVQSTSFSSLSKRVRELIPLSRVANFTENQLIEVIKDLPPASAITMKVAEVLMDKEKDILPAVVSRLGSMLPYIGGSDAMKFNETYIMESLNNMQGINPPFVACTILKEKLVNNTRNLMGDRIRDPIEGISGPDVEKIPVGVMAAFGANRIAKLDAHQKIILFERLGKMKNSELSTLRQARMAIVSEGLRAMRSGEGVRPGELTTIGNALADIPANELNRARPEVMYEIVMKFINMIKTEKRRPCLDTNQRAALVQMVKKIKMQGISEWKTVDDVCCLLYTFSREDLDKINPEVLNSCSCDPANPSPSTMLKEKLCQVALEDDFFRMKDAERSFNEAQVAAAIKVIKVRDYNVEAQAEVQATSGRRKRETAEEDITCDKAAYGGANAFTVYELQMINQTIMFSCLKYFGMAEIDKQKAEVLAGKINSSKGNRFEDLKAEEITDMKFIILGFNAADLHEFPSFQYNTFNDAVAAMGMMRGFDRDQERVLARKVILEWRRPTEMTADEVHMVNHLFCGYDSNDLNMPLRSFKGGIQTLSKLNNCCEVQVLQKLALRAMEAYGNPSTWGKAEVAELGVIVAGLTPEKLASIKPQAMEGLCSSVVMKFDSNEINALNESHIAYMNAAAAFTFTDDQKKSFSPLMLNALENVESAAKSSGSRTFSGQATVLLTLLLCCATLKSWRTRRFVRICSDFEDF